MTRRGAKLIVATGAAMALLGVTPGSGQSLQDRLADGRQCPKCPELVAVPAGHFTMGSPPGELERFGGEAQVHVSISRPFAAGKYAVTFEQWDACVEDGGCNGYRPDDRGWGRGKWPVIGVNWTDAKAYTTWLSAKTGQAYRLLSETEREYAARAGAATPFWWGASITTGQANYNGNYAYAGASNGEYRQRTVPVDSFEPNPWGLYQVHGNVWEWTEDCWNDSSEPGPRSESPRTDGDCSRRVVRGGSFYNIPSFLRAARRHWYAVDIRIAVVGFRVGRALDRPAAN